MVPVATEHVGCDITLAVGAVGVAGGMPSDDEAIAQAAADVINN